MGGSNNVNSNSFNRSNNYQLPQQGADNRGSGINNVRQGTPRQPLSCSSESSGLFDLILEVPRTNDTHTCFRVEFPGGNSQKSLAFEILVAARPLRNAPKIAFTVKGRPAGASGWPANLESVMTTQVGDGRSPVPIRISAVKQLQRESPSGAVCLDVNLQQADGASEPITYSFTYNENTPQPEVQKGADEVSGVPRKEKETEEKELGPGSGAFSKSAPNSADPKKVDADIPTNYRTLVRASSQVSSEKPKSFLPSRYYLENGRLTCEFGYLGLSEKYFKHSLYVDTCCRGLFASDEVEKQLFIDLKRLYSDFKSTDRSGASRILQSVDNIRKLLEDAMAKAIAIVLDCFYEAKDRKIAADSAVHIYTTLSYLDCFLFDLRKLASEPDDVNVT